MALCLQELSIHTLYVSNAFFTPLADPMSRLNLPPTEGLKGGEFDVPKRNHSGVHGGTVFAVELRHGLLFIGFV